MGPGQGFLSLGLVSITPASSSKTINRKCCTLLQNPVAPQVLFQIKPRIVAITYRTCNVTIRQWQIHIESRRCCTTWRFFSYHADPWIPYLPPPCITSTISLLPFYFHDSGSILVALSKEVAIVLLLNIQFLLGPFPYDPHSEILGNNNSLALLTKVNGSILHLIL